MNSKRPTLFELNQRGSRDWLKRYEILKGQYLVEQDDMDPGVIMSGQEIEPIIVDNFQDALKIITDTSDQEIRITIYDSNGDIVHVHWEN